METEKGLYKILTSGENGLPLVISAMERAAAYYSGWPDQKGFYNDLADLLRERTVAIDDPAIKQDEE